MSMEFSRKEKERNPNITDQFRIVIYIDHFRRVPIVATLVTFGISSLWGSLLSGGRYFRGKKSFTNRAGASFFSDGIDGLPDYHMGESADIEEIEFFTDSEVES